LDSLTDAIVEDLRWYQIHEVPNVTLKQGIHYAHKPEVVKKAKHGSKFMCVPLKGCVYEQQLNFSVADIPGREHVQLLGKIDVFNNQVFKYDADLPNRVSRNRLQVDERRTAIFVNQISKLYHIDWVPRSRVN
jgi:hypothetical protein